MLIQFNFRSKYEDELIERIVVPNLSHIDTDPDVTIRNVAAHLLVDLCIECETKRCLELLDILEKVRDYMQCRNTPFFFSQTKWIEFRIANFLLQIINKPFTSEAPIAVETDVKDVKTAVVGVINILTVKMYRLPSSHVIRAYKLLVNHLEQHYKEPSIFHNVSTIRYLVSNIFSAT